MKRPWMPAAGFRGVIAPAVAGVMVSWFGALHAIDPVEAFVGDLLLRMMPERAARHVVAVGIDEASLLREGPWPWPRSRLAELVSRTGDAGAAAVGIDVLLPDSRPGDAELAAACRRVRCVVATTLDTNGNWILPAASLAPDVHPAHAAFELDDDGILRRFSVTKQDRGLSLPAFASALAALASGLPIAAGRAVIPRFATAPHEVPLVSASAVLHGDPDVRGRLRGRIAVIGMTATALGDRVMTPRSRRHTSDPGVLVHAASVESLLTGDVLRELSPIGSGLIAAVLVGLALRVARLGGGRRAIGEAALLAGPAVFAWLLVFAHMLIPAVSVSAAVAFTVLTVETRRALALARHGRAAADTLERETGRTPATGGDVGVRLESLAAEIVRRRVDEVESKRILAHELKTPLAAVRSLSQVLGGLELTAGERQRMAMLLGEETEKLEAMVTGLLEVERLALRPRGDGCATLDLSRLVSSRIAFLSHGLSRSLETSIEASLEIEGDALLIERVLDNLAGNAVKYSAAPAPVTVALRREGDTAVLDVMDRGLGVPASERERIFRRFARGSSAAGTDGLGLGLALVAEVVTWHRGTIEALERQGGGSTFRVRLPLAQTRSAVAEAV